MNTTIDFDIKMKEDRHRPHEHKRIKKIKVGAIPSSADMVPKIKQDEIKEPNDARSVGFKIVKGMNSNRMRRLINSVLQPTKEQLTFARRQTKKHHYRRPTEPKAVNARARRLINRANQRAQQATNSNTNSATLRWGDIMDESDLIPQHSAEIKDSLESLSRRKRAKLKTEEKEVIVEQKAGDEISPVIHKLGLMSMGNTSNLKNNCIPVDGVERTSSVYGGQHWDHNGAKRTLCTHNCTLPDAHDVVHLSKVKVVNKKSHCTCGCVIYVINRKKDCFDHPALARFHFVAVAPVPQNPMLPVLVPVAPLNLLNGPPAPIAANVPNVAALAQPVVGLPAAVVANLPPIVNPVQNVNNAVNVAPVVQPNVVIAANAPIVAIAPVVPAAVAGVQQQPIVPVPLALPANLPLFSAFLLPAGPVPNVYNASTNVLAGSEASAAVVAAAFAHATDHPVMPNEIQQTKVILHSSTDDRIITDRQVRIQLGDIVIVKADRINPNAWINTLGDIFHVARQLPSTHTTKVLMLFLAFCLWCSWGTILSFTLNFTYVLVNIAQQVLWSLAISGLITTAILVVAFPTPARLIVIFVANFTGWNFYQLALIVVGVLGIFYELMSIYIWVFISFQLPTLDFTALWPQYFVEATLAAPVISAFISECYNAYICSFLVQGTLLYCPMMLTIIEQSTDINATYEQCLSSVSMRTRCCPSLNIPAEQYEAIMRGTAAIFLANHRIRAKNVVWLA